MTPNHIPEGLKRFFEENHRVALAFSGGSDSTYLFYAAVACGAEIKAYHVKSQFQFKTESKEAERTAKLLGREMEIIPLDVLSFPEVACNPENRCYLCKKAVFGNILKAAEKDGFSLVIDATNASDDPADRPGMKALTEMGVRSPLRECDITKPMVRELSKIAGLRTWNIPSNSCLATRIPTGMMLTEENLERTERIEAELKKLGLTEFRLRTRGTGACLEVVEKDEETLSNRRNEIEDLILKEYSSLTYGRRKPGL